MDSLPPKIDFKEIRLAATQTMSLMQQGKFEEAQQALAKIFPAIDAQDNAHHQWSQELTVIAKYFR